jgi:ribonuclease HII
MIELDQIYPEYGFAKHKGYGTKEHLEALSKYGPIQGQHRSTFAPIKNLIRA